MPIIDLTTIIYATPENCFDLSLNIDLHMQSMEQTNEKAIGGITSGAIKLGETVRWRARHFGIYFTMTIQIADLIRPVRFTDEMIKGPFKYLRHQHFFEPIPEGTHMTDRFDFQSPLGILGSMADQVFLESYMRNLLIKRNEWIKAIAERKENL